MASKPLIRVDVRKGNVVVSIVDGPSSMTVYLTREHTKEVINQLTAAVYEI